MANENENETEAKQQQSADNSSNEFEEKLPEQIRDHILLEGVNSSELLQNTDIVNFANILSTLRWDLSTLLNEEIDEFQFQTICQDLLEKTSENIKIKPEKAKKSQMLPPTPKSQQINLDDIYNHLKRQPWHYPHHLSPIVATQSEGDALSEHSEDQKTPHATVGENTGEVMIGFFDVHIAHPNPHSRAVAHKAHDSGTPSSLELKHDMETQPGSCSAGSTHHVHDMKMDDVDDSDDSDDDDEENEPGDTLMGCCDKNAIQFNLPPCYQEIFHENVNKIMNEVKSKSDSTTAHESIETPTLDHHSQRTPPQPQLEENDTNDDDDAPLLECNDITIMGALGSDAIL